MHRALNPAVTLELPERLREHAIAVALEAAADIVAVVRSEERAAGSADRGVTTAVAAYEDVPALSSAFSGVDRLVLVSGQRGGPATGAAHEHHRGREGRRTPLRCGGRRPGQRCGTPRFQHGPAGPHRSPDNRGPWKR